MDQTAYASDLIEKIRRGLEDFAAAKGWSPGSCRIFVHVDEVWDKIHIVFVVPKLGNIEEGDGKRRPGHAFPNTPIEFLLRHRGDIDLDEFLGIVSMWVITDEDYRKGGIYSLPPTYRPIEEFLK